MTSKTIKHLHPAVRDDIADLITRRPVPGAEIEQVDPFLFLNHHGPQVYPPRNGGLPFGPHPHRGFETVTFILTGELAHRDSAGHESVIKEGGIQWMTAGSGLVHAEISPDDFKRSGGPLEILQLWVSRMLMAGYHFMDRRLPFTNVPDSLCKSMTQCPPGAERTMQCSAPAPESCKRMSAPGDRPARTSFTPSGNRIPERLPPTAMSSASM